MFSLLFVIISLFFAKIFFVLINTFFVKVFFIMRFYQESHNHVWLSLCRIVKERTSRWSTKRHTRIFHTHFVCTQKNTHTHTKYICIHLSTVVCLAISLTLSYSIGVCLGCSNSYWLLYRVYSSLIHIYNNGNKVFTCLFCLRIKSTLCECVLQTTFSFILHGAYA